MLCLEFNAEVIATAVTLLAVLSRGIPPPTMANRGGVFRKSPGSVPTTTWTELFLSASKGNVSEIELKSKGCNVPLFHSCLISANICSMLLTCY